MNVFDRNKYVARRLALAANHDLGQFRTVGWQQYEAHCRNPGCRLVVRVTRSQVWENTGVRTQDCPVRTEETHGTT